jgi:hypothetical protein
MEKAGTGGALFRNLYRDFIDESFKILGISELRQAYHLFSKIAIYWYQVSQLLDQAG